MHRGHILSTNNKQLKCPFCLMHSKKTYFYYHKYVFKDILTSHVHKNVKN